jgi:hypothetical protein
MLYIVNHLSIPTSLTHSYPVFGGVQDGLVQWWYGHNAVAFFLTTPILGIMYYFLPKAAERPVYSYRLSIVHFWSLVFIYIWAGPHHLLNTAAAELAADARHDVLPHALGPLLGRHAQRPAHPPRRLGQAPHRSGPQVLRRRRHLLRHGHLRRAAALDQGQRPRPLHRLDHRPRARRRPRLERLHGRRHVLLAAPAPLAQAAPLRVPGPTSTSGSGLSASCSTSPPCGSPASCRASCSTPPPPDGTASRIPNFIDTLNSIRPLMLMRVIGGSSTSPADPHGLNIWQTIRGAQAVNETHRGLRRSSPPQRDTMGLKRHLPQ